MRENEPYLKDDFVIKRAKDTVSVTYTINHLNDEDIAGTFNENELQKKKQLTLGSKKS